MSHDNFKSKQFEVLPSMVQLMVDTNALLATTAELIIETSAKDDEHRKELTRILDERHRAHLKRCREILVESGK